jgi:hypothetical protein
MSAVSQEVGLTKKLQTSSSLKTVQSLLSKFITEELTVDERLRRESKRDLKQAIDSLVDQAWLAAETHTFGPKSTASKVPQLHVSSKIESFTEQRTEQGLTPKPTAMRSRRTASTMEVKSSCYVPSSQRLSPSTNLSSSCLNFNSSVMTHSPVKSGTFFRTSLKDSADFGPCQDSLSALKQKTLPAEKASPDIPTTAKMSGVAAKIPLAGHICARPRRLTTGL